MYRDCLELYYTVTINDRESGPKRIQKKACNAASKQSYEKQRNSSMNRDNRDPRLAMPETVGNRNSANSE
jgi:hypothetical protein